MVLLIAWTELYHFVRVNAHACWGGGGCLDLNEATEDMRERCAIKRLQKSTHDCGEAFKHDEKTPTFRLNTTL